MKHPFLNDGSIPYSLLESFVCLQVFCSYLAFSFTLIFFFSLKKMNEFKDIAIKK